MGVRMSHNSHATRYRSELVTSAGNLPRLLYDTVKFQRFTLSEVD